MNLRIVIKLNRYRECKETNNPQFFTLTRGRKSYRMSRKQIMEDVEDLLEEMIDEAEKKSSLRGASKHRSS